ncbi:epidermal growth factor receptor isoform X2 [Ischnura elegans]|uniref:epidermal growth factor receptor isoform X2 n=1 Tax=Ischnura elegans TaxID=197161 RepID=UPI001ED8A642|nr:epidermal growth factor receptor isoform X2 [Ischnura elegans]
MKMGSVKTYLFVVLCALSCVMVSGRGGKKSEFVKGKICIGTNGRMSVPSNREHHYRNLRDRYTNCTYVDGNLELTWLQDEDLDLSFLQYIREVTGYVLISHVDVRRIVLPRLQIIRGRTLFKLSVHDEEFALLATLSKMHNLELPALRDILQGSVGLLNNYNLCHVKTINWEEIITGPNAKKIYVYNFSNPERECPPCHHSCKKGCWGEGPENCQKFSKINCSPQCYQGRCFGANPRECCHLFCAGGCTGPKQSDCLACRNFYDDGVCKQECPAMQRYNPTKYSWETNPNGKYAYGATCVKNCPEHLLKDNGACVRSCPPKKMAVNGECVPCDGPCPKTCEGVKILHSGNVDNFRDCTIIEGSLTILDHSFAGFQQYDGDFIFGPRHGSMHPDRLEVFSTLKEVTEHVNIQASHPAFTNLSYFRNLEVIGGRALTDLMSSLYIVKSSLKSLGLQSLKKIHSGGLAIVENKDLCFAEGINWDKIKKSTDHPTYVRHNKPLAECQKEGLVCHNQCSSEGCWGPGPDQCLSCANFQVDNICIESCNTMPGLYQAGPKLCMHCHEECESTCHGPGPGNCTRCKHVKDGPFCTVTCPDSKYNDNKSSGQSGGECRPCHENCVDGCSGPENTIGPNGCHSCEKAILNGDVSVERCLKKNEPCPDGHYYEWVGPQDQGPLKPLAGKAVCRRCHPRCKKCTGYGFHIQVCQECVSYRRGEQCEDECPPDHYARNDTQECLPCSQECRGCYGPTASDCIGCRNYRIYQDGSPESNSTLFNCSGSCPPEAPHKVFPQDNIEPYCSREPLVRAYQSGDAENTPIILAVVLVFAAIAVVCSVVLGIQWRMKAKAKDNAVKMTRVLTGMDREDNEPLRPTNVKPNLAKLRIVKEAELRKGGIMGYGAFGTVYKGVWVPEGENVKIPVAIKVLREGTGANTSKEFLEEAYIMASVEHPNLLQLLAVCMTSQMMLVTQLMPLGSLLDYVRNNRSKIGSKPLLNWCTQIARGMAYLEDKRLVHRDLAARNVLVQTPNCVKITDFGLAKLLDINEDEYKAAGGKMPIKWLALECIQHRIFTHKSDVWAFGVTVWELLTYGGRPYESVPARDVPELLEKGERLPQPSMCTIDVYMIMIKCWMLDAESRPSFKELADEFAKMSRDPGRYLVIQGDRLMRLPSYSPQDEKELIRNLSSAMDGPEALVDADEYLQPKSRAPIAPSSLTVSASLGPPSSSSLGSTSPPHTPIKKWSGTTGMCPMPHGNPGVDMAMAGIGLPQGSSISTSDEAGNHAAVLPSDSPTPQNLQNWDRELRYGHNMDVHDGRPQGPLHSDGSSSRYCSDPLKMLGRDCDTGSDDCFNPGTNKREAQVGNLKLELPLDEDDYLMPSPQLNQGTSPYMDLIGDSKITENGEPRNGGFRGYPDFLPATGKTKTSVDNPEYHIMSQNGNGPTPEVAIPSCNADVEGVSVMPPSQGQPHVNGGIVGAGVPANGPPYLTQQKSSEEESDHEYYNDFDRLQRELQPLKPFRRNETTV